MPSPEKAAIVVALGGETTKLSSGGTYIARRFSHHRLGPRARRKQRHGREEVARRTEFETPSPERALSSLAKVKRIDKRQRRDASWRSLELLEDSAEEGARRRL
uniref:Uncharacterized protein n=1 Tax=Oryza sativa subsp. japonica TaxID=39947 RepID=Q8S7P5_ORYSJ|nr:hypothetical protein [Oryza sativa Japonica Group]